MRTIICLSILVLLSGCEGDSLARMRRVLGGGKEKKIVEKTCRACGTELSQRNKCLNITCPFSSLRQDELREAEKTIAKQIDAEYAKLQLKNDLAEKYRAKDMASRPWGSHWNCRRCDKLTYSWIPSIKVDGNTYQGPFMCCNECEESLKKHIEYLKRR